MVLANRIDRDVFKVFLQIIAEYGENKQKALIHSLQWMNNQKGKKRVYIYEGPAEEIAELSEIVEIKVSEFGQILVGAKFGKCGKKVWWMNYFDSPHYRHWLKRNKAENSWGYRVLMGIEDEKDKKED